MVEHQNAECKAIGVYNTRTTFIARFYLHYFGRGQEGERKFFPTWNFCVAYCITKSESARADVWDHVDSHEQFPTIYLSWLAVSEKGSRNPFYDAIDSSGKVLLMESRPWCLLQLHKNGVVEVMKVLMLAERSRFHDKREAS